MWEENQFTEVLFINNNSLETTTTAWSVLSKHSMWPQVQLNWHSFSSLLTRISSLILIYLLDFYYALNSYWPKIN